METPSSENKAAGNTSLIIFTFLNFLFLAAAVGVYCWIFFDYLKKDWVKSSECVAPVGEYSVEPGVDVSTVLELCPDSSSDNNQCIYTVGTLLEATRICNQKADICNKFVYNPSSEQMKIVSLKAIPRQSGAQYNTYTRQANITYRNSGTGTVGDQSVQSPDNSFTIATDGTITTTTNTATLQVA